MITYRVTLPPQAGEVALRLLKIPGAMEKAGRNAVQRTLKGAKQDAARKIGERYTIAVSNVTATIKTKLKGLTGEMESKGSRNPLEKFKINPTTRRTPQPSQGIHALVVKSQGGQIKHGFITRRYKGVYERTGKARFPIRRFYSPSAPGMLSVMPVSKYILAKMEERLGKNLDHAASAILGGYL